MKKVLNKIALFFKKNLLGMIIGAAVVGGITLVNADYRFTATKVYYDKSSSNTYTSKTNVGAALDELYSKAAYGNAAASQILKDKTALVGGKQVTGTIPSISFTTEKITPGTSDKTISVGTGNYISSGGTKTILGDSDLKAENIVRGVEIFGVKGNSGIFKSKTFTNTAATIKTYQGTTDITSSGHKFDDGTYIGNYTDGVWKRLSYKGSTYNYYSIITIPLPSGVSISSGGEYVVQVSLGTNYATDSNKKDDYGFRVGSSSARYTHSIHCSGTNVSTEWGYNSVDGGQWLDTSNSYSKDSALNTTCGVDGNTIYIKLKTEFADNERAKYCWWTRGSAFYLSGRIFYN